MDGGFPCHQYCKVHDKIIDMFKNKTPRESLQGIFRFLLLDCISMNKETGGNLVPKTKVHTSDLQSPTLHCSKNCCLEVNDLITWATDYFRNPSFSLRIWNYIYKFHSKLYFPKRKSFIRGSTDITGLRGHHTLEYCNYLSFFVFWEEFGSMCSRAKVTRTIRTVVSN